MHYLYIQNLLKMKTFIKGLFYAVILVQISCTAQNRQDISSINSLLSNDEFTFSAERAIPTSVDAINILNTLPGGSTQRILNLDEGYGLTIKKEEISANLPYFGQTYSAAVAMTDRTGIRFVSKDFEIQKGKPSKKSETYIIHPKDQKYVRTLILEVFSNGKAYLSINSNDRQPISYEGNIKPVRAIK